MQAPPSSVTVPPNSSTVPVGPKHITLAATPIEQVLTRRHLQELAREVDPNEQLDDDVEEFLLSYAEDYMEKVIEGSCTLARHRKAAALEPKDVQTFLERGCNLWSPAFGSDELRAYKRAPVTESHKQRIALIKKTVKKY